MNTPNRSLTNTHDTKGVEYIAGNRKQRRTLFAMATKKQNTRNLLSSKKNKLPKELWEDGKSKFLDVRLKEENKRHISELLNQ